jgi:hypothetical protein
MIEKIENAGIEATCIGTVKSADSGIRFNDGRVIDPPSVDEIYKVVS